MAHCTLLARFGFSAPLAFALPGTSLRGGGGGAAWSLFLEVPDALSGVFAGVVVGGLDEDRLTEDEERLLVLLGVDRDVLALNLLVFSVFFASWSTSIGSGVGE